MIGFGGLLPFVHAEATQAQEFVNARHRLQPDLVLDPDEGEVYLIGERQGRVTIKVDKRDMGNEALSLLTEHIKPGDGIPVHKHASEEELIFVRQAHVLRRVDRERIRADVISPPKRSVISRTSVPVAYPPSEPVTRYPRNIRFADLVVPII